MKLFSAISSRIRQTYIAYGRFVDLDESNATIKKYIIVKTDKEGKKWYLSELLREPIQTGKDRFIMPSTTMSSNINDSLTYDSEQEAQKDFAHVSGRPLDKSDVYEIKTHRFTPDTLRGQAWFRGMVESNMRKNRE